MQLSNKETDEYLKKAKETIEFLQGIYEQIIDDRYRDSKRSKWISKGRDEKELVETFIVPSKYTKYCHVTICEDVKTDPETASEAYVSDELLTGDEFFDGYDRIFEFPKEVSIHEYSGLMEVVISRMKGMYTIKPRRFIHIQGIFSKKNLRKPSGKKDSKKVEEIEGEIEGEEVIFTIFASIKAPKTFKMSKVDKSKVEGTYYPSGGIFFRKSTNGITRTIFVEVLQLSLGGWMLPFVMEKFGGHELESVTKYKKFIEEWTEKKKNKL